MRQLATIQQIAEKRPIEGADAIEAVRINGWWCVAKKGEFEVGDPCVYFEIDSFLPASNPAFDFLKNASGTKKMQLDDGTVVEGMRLKTIRLRGQLSQGLALPVELFRSLGFFKATTKEVGDDVSEELEVYKYQGGERTGYPMKAKGGFPSFLHKTDEERIQNLPDILERYADTDFYITEKIDGSSCTFFKKDSEFGMCSRNLELKMEDSNQLKVAQMLGIIDNLPDGFAIQGELFGEGIQKNPLRMKGVHFNVYNVFNIDADCFLDINEALTFCENMDLAFVPVVGRGLLKDIATNVEEALALADGDTAVINGSGKREGIVFRPTHEMRGEMRSQEFGRISFKAISNAYLLKHE